MPLNRSIDPFQLRGLCCLSVTTPLQAVVFHRYKMGSLSHQRLHSQNSDSQSIIVIYRHEEQFVIFTLLSFSTVCLADLPTLIPPGQSADNDQITALQAYQQTFVCTEFFGDYWKDTAKQCERVCVPRRQDGEAANSTRGEWVEGSATCSIESEWLDFRTGLPSDNSRKFYSCQSIMTDTM